MKLRWQKIVIPAILVAAVGLVVVAKHIKYTCDWKAVDTAGSKTTAVDNVVNNENAEQLPLLLELGSHSCIPCKQMMPILKELTESYQGQLRVQFIDVMQDNESAQKYNVQLIPLQIFFDKQGNELFRHEGFFAKEDILAKWKELGIELTDKK
ncbi:MAG TPA: thioredoxin family protein [Sedimentisphaerales bacterium]|nr:thioredoxin family protein [Sedimentisphaerales bacterium]